MRIDLTDVELTLLIQTVETSTYAGKLSDIVTDLRKKLHAANDEPTTGRES